MSPKNLRRIFRSYLLTFVKLLLIIDVHNRKILQLSYTSTLCFSFFKDNSTKRISFFFKLYCYNWMHHHSPYTGILTMHQRFHAISPRDELLQNYIALISTSLSVVNLQKTTTTQGNIIEQFQNFRL